MEKRSAFVSCRLDPELRSIVQRRAEELGVTVSSMTKSLLERETCCRRVSGARHIDAAERNRLTRCYVRSLAELWNPKEAA